jgi:hypothetical protein
MASDGGDQEHQHGGLREWLEGEPVEKQPDHGDNDERQRDRERDRRMMAGGPERCGEHDAGENDIDDEGARDLPGMQRATLGEQIEREGSTAHRDRELGGARHLAGSQRGIGQRAIGDELALGNQDHPRHGEHQHEREPEQRIDRTIGDTVLDQEQQDRRIHARTLPLKAGPSVD